MSSLLSVRHYSHELLSHSHDHAQLVFGLSGQLDFEVDGRGSQVLRQTLAVVPGNALHSCGSPRGSQCLVLDVPGRSWIAQQLGEHQDATCRLLDKHACIQLNSAQSQLVNWLAASPVHDPVIAQQGAALLLASIASADTLTAQTAGLPLAAIDAYIEQHAAHPLQVSDLARLAGLSAARFHVRFLQATGQTPMDYVRERRLQLARQWLQETALPIGEIAQRAGYASQSAFTAALTRRYGHSPRALRQAAGHARGLR